MTEARYQVVDGSQSSHCCFEATAVDTTKPIIIAGEHWTDSDGKPQWEAICECFSREDADQIAAAMNAS